MNIELDLPVGKYRELTAEEFKNLNELIGNSSKTEEASQLSTESKKENQNTKRPRVKRKK